jgi:predicted nucleic acid-binding protein
LPRDIVIDTNVFMHAGNPHVEYFDGARAFLEALQNANTLLCIDMPRADSTPSKSSSLIWDEYERKMKATTYGMVVLAKLASSKRVAWVSRDVGAAISKQIQALVPKNTRDKTFIRVAYHSSEKLFMSNDSKDFGPGIRKAIRKALSVHVAYSDISFATL